MSRFLSFLLGCLPILAIAAAPAPPSPPAGNRYLFIVDTSSAMRQFKHDGRQLVFDLIFSGCRNRMRTGDTFGIWTFNREVSAGEFPMQVWHPDKGLDLANTAALFLKEQNYQKSARLGPVFSQVLPLISNVKGVQVLIVTSGQSELSETNVIRDFWLAWQSKAEAARKAKSPLVIALSARNGKIATWSFAIGDEPIGLPTPPAPIVAAPSPGATNVQGNAPTPRVVEVKTLVSPPPDAAAPPPVPPKVPEKPAPAPIIIQRSQPDPTNSAQLPPPSTDLPVIPKDKLPEERQSEGEAAAAQAPIIATQLMKTSEAEPPLPEKSGDNLPLPSVGGRGEGETRAPHPAVPLAETSLDAPAIMPASNTQTKQPVAAVESPVLPTVATVPPPTPSKRPWLFWGGGICLLGGLLALWSFLRPRRHTSFITQSMNRES